MTTSQKSNKSIAYIVSQYPMLSMIFIIREIIELKKLGFKIDVASINLPDRNIENLVADEANEAKLTHYIKKDAIKQALVAHVSTLCLNPKGYLNGLIKVSSLSAINLKSYFYNFMYFTQALMVGVWMKKKNQVHLHAHLGSQAMTVAMFVKSVHGYTISATVHGPDEFYDAFGQYLTQKVIAADFIICISNFARSQLMKLSPYEHWHKFEVSRLGVDPSVFIPRPFNAHPEQFQILCVGRLTPAKGQHILVDAIGQLIKQGRQVQLRLVGDGVDRASLHAHVKSLSLEEAIIFEGAVNQDSIRDLYAQADIFCIPSFAEGIPVVLMEAMAMEIPCVTTRITGIPELIEDGYNGLLVAPSSVEELVTAFIKLMDNAELRLTLGQKGREKVMNDYNLVNNVNRLAEVFSARL